MIAAIKRLFARYGFSRTAHDNDWIMDREASRSAWLREQVTISKNRRLAQIVQERNALKDKLAKAIRDKKARAPIYQALRALSIEELRTETGK